MNKVGLIILDGWGLGDRSKADAIFNAKTPYMDYLLANYPNSQLATCGTDVGLPEGQMGNSEVGHLNIGAGRIVYQELSRINNTIADGSFFSNKTLLNAIEYARKNDVKIHLLGLVSHGGVHSAFNHLVALIDFCKTNEAKKVYIHAITDGRDCDPLSAQKDIETLQTMLTPSIELASIIGRYFAMDRDQRWERIEKAYNLYTKGKGESFLDANTAIKASYDKGVTDEFIEPVILNPEGVIENGDVVICFNFRTDRPREITQVLSQHPIDGFEMSPLNLHYVTMTNYDDTFHNVHVVFEKDTLPNTLGELLAKAGKSQIRIAETEKYPHVTYFFNGGRELPFELESRILVNSPKVATYDLQPEMSAKDVTKKLLDAITLTRPDFFCLNYANPDMVGHTGVYSAILTAIETIDQQLKEVVEALLPQGYSLMVIADHGNADVALNPDGSPNTAHSLNKVPCVLISEYPYEIQDGRLADIAPTILALLSITQAPEMTGKSLIKKGA